MGHEKLNQSHLYILNNTQEVLPYIVTHNYFFMATHPKSNMMKVLQEYNKIFINWFKETILGDDNASKTLKLLSMGPKLNVPTWKGCDINNFSFYTKSQNDKSRVQNSGVSLDVDSLHFSSASNNNPICASIPYFGVIEEIWELDYSKFIVPIFKCKWINGNTDV